MASSSLSQESLDRDDFDLSNRRSRMKVTRCRAAPVYSKNESVETTDDKDVDDDEYVGKSGAGAGAGAGAGGPQATGGASSVMLIAGSSGGGGAVEHISFSPGSVLFASDHDSPTRAKIKDKRGWPGHLHKAKPAKDKRKLREKRRSSGLVHMQSTESTGDSLDENDKDRCTYNEVIDADNPQTPEEDRKAFTSRAARNKSPSDLDADLEDNQDYDSTVSQPETNSSNTATAAASSCGHKSLATTLRPATTVSCGTVISATTDGDRNRAYDNTLTKDDVVRRRDDVASKDDGNARNLHSTGGVVAGECRGRLDKCAVAADDKSSNVLEKTLAKEKEKNKQLQKLLDQKEKIINELERKIADLTNEATV